jgi:hypothetical protein
VMTQAESVEPQFPHTTPGHTVSWLEAAAHLACVTAIPAQKNQLKYNDPLVHVPLWTMTLRRRSDS